MQPSLTLSQFSELSASHSVVPLAVEVLADRHTPVSVFDTLVDDDDGFLLESVEGGERWARWSFIGWNPAFTLSSTDGVTTADAPVAVPSGDPLEVLEAMVGRFSVPDPDDLGFPGPVPPLHSGLVGYLAYDAVRYIERLDSAPVDDRHLPEMLWQFAGGIAAFDRLRETITLIFNVFTTGDADADYRSGVESLERAVVQLGLATTRPVPNRPRFDRQVDASASMTEHEFIEVVDTCIDHIREGDAFQIVPSIRFEAEFSGNAFAVYRALRLVNPSPYMFFVRSGDLAIAGSSPELMARVRDGKAYSRPIAGTRPRGTTVEEDEALAGELLADPKERAEHVMLIDLARNDLGRVCEFGTVSVDDLMVIERYSHVMHIVSGVSGTIADGVGPLDVLRATFPHGTVSGAPKVRAMEIIDSLEPMRRGPYAGAVGYLDFSGNLDTAIALRTCVTKGTSAWVQAGAGIVVDSHPPSEYRECVNKAKAVLTAIAASDEI